MLKFIGFICVYKNTIQMVFASSYPMNILFLFK